MTIINFNEDGIVCEEIVLERNPQTNKLEKICEWFFNGTTLVYTAFKNRDRLGNFYTSQREYKGKDCEYWIKNKTKKKLKIT